MFGSRPIEKKRKPSKFRDNKEKEIKKEKPSRAAMRQAKELDETSDYEQGC